MASSMCMRCLGQSLSQTGPSSFTAANTIHRAAFSTSSSLSAQPVKKKAVAAKPGTKAGRTLRLSKNTRAASARPPAPGERKALRKKIVLSNTNALEVTGLQDLSKSNISSERLQALQGKVLGLEDDTVDILRALEVFKPTQGWSLFRRPATLVRKETAELAGDLQWVVESNEGRTVRKVLYGARGSGKSVLQLQALAMASLKGWVVVHVPEAKDLTNAHTSYEPISTPEGTVYIQTSYTAKLLENIGKANEAVFSKLQVTQDHKLPIPLPPKTTLARLVEIGSKDPELAWPVWKALWSELLASSSKEGNVQKVPPILYSLDAVDHIMRLSAYLNAEVEPIHAHELALVRHFVGLLSGRTSLPNGGMILAATSESNRAAAQTLDFALQRNMAVQNEQEPPAWDPYIAHDKWVQEAMETVGVQKMEGLSKAEARGIMEYYAHSGMLRSTVTDGLVSEKWTLAGGGIIGQIENASVRVRF
ncbi:mitochondrial ribosomal protein Dap3 [Zymoseptoria brevis]|uniref:Small ribosomal subunit protein mS29 n=1 Tax=Zymoseptoria brevis TaxID=1047168 RepID=A0A0F4G8Z3_9PEZI|nr:mitochondrial ribosomal protein Dap3 [Zymoseptoria brevis]